MSDPKLVHEILSQILVAAKRIERRFHGIDHPDDFLSSDEGIDRMDEICMMLIAIGESLKNLESITGGEFFSRHPDVDWKGAKGVRDILSHHDFDADPEVLFFICQKHLPSLVQAIQSIQEHER